MFPSLGMPEMLVIMIVAVILFGKRLPDVGRSLGKGLVEFKKGLRGIEDEFHSAASAASTSDRYDDRDRRPADVAEPTVPKFEPPPAYSTPEAEPQPYHD